MITFQHLGHCMNNKACWRRARLSLSMPSDLARPWHCLLAISARKPALMLAAGLLTFLSGIAIG